jgi:ATP-dependent RNA helicase RhlE
VNYDLPNVSEDYVHRIGRTGRAGSNGVAVSLVCVDEHQMLRDIEKLIKQKLPQEVIAGFEPDPNAVAQPIQLRSQQHQQSRKPRPGNAGGGNGGGSGGARPPAKRSSPPKRSFNR